MKKKIKNLTLLDINKLCKSQSFCNNCPLFIRIGLCLCDLYMFPEILMKYKPMLNRRIKL